MAELGTIFADEPGEGERGRDLRIAIAYPAWALGDAEGVWVDVAGEVELEGEAVARTPSPYDRPGQILLRLPETFPARGALRLRGQGETPAGGGRAGDLFLEITIDRGALRAVGPHVPALPAGRGVDVALIVVAVAGAAALWVLAT